MTSLNTGLWRAPQNTQIPAIDHVLSFKATYTALAAGGTTTLTFPSTTGLGSAQYTAAQAPTNYAITASPALPNNEPQQGLFLYVTHLSLRNFVGGPLTPSGGTAATNAVQLIDVTQSNAVVANIAGPAAAASAPAYIFTPITTGLLVINPYDALAITINGSTGTASANTGFILDVFGYFNQAV